MESSFGVDTFFITFAIVCIFFALVDITAFFSSFRTFPIAFFAWHYNHFIISFFFRDQRLPLFCTTFATFHADLIGKFEIYAIFALYRLLHEELSNIAQWAASLKLKNCFDRCQQKWKFIQICEKKRAGKMWIWMKKNSLDNRFGYSVPSSFYSSSMLRCQPCSPVALYISDSKNWSCFCIFHWLYSWMHSDRNCSVDLESDVPFRSNVQPHR